MATKVAAAYAIVGSLWILTSDKVLEAFVSDPAQVAEVQTAKDWVFLLFSTVLIYLLARHALRRHESVIADLQAGQRALAASETELRETVRQLESLHLAHEAKQQDYALLFSANPQPMWIFDPQTLDFLAVNDAAVAQYGYSRDEWLRMRISDIRPPEEIPRLLENVGLRRTEVFSDAEIWTHVKKDGTPIQVEISAHSMTYRGRPARVVKAIDVTDRTRLRRAMEDSETRFRTLVEQGVVGTYIVDGDVFTYASPRMEEIFGYGPGEMVGMKVTDLASPVDQSRVAERIQRRLSGQESSARYQGRGRRKDGSEIMVEVHGTVADIGGRPLIIGVADDITARSEADQRELAHLRRTEEAMLGTITIVSRMVEVRDPYTAGHERRVAEIAVAIANELQLSAERVEGLRIGASIHDIGKIAIPSDILSKPGRLSPIEYEYVKHHAEAGFQLLDGVSFPWPLAEMVHQHHERINGSGYPRGLKEDQIMLEARILAVADTVEAMASHRPYRAARGLELAIEEIERNAGILYDPEVASTCIRLFREQGYELPK